MDNPPFRVISGGQTGVDRAALDAAAAAGLPRGGWCPAGRRAEDGTIAPGYPLLETPSPDPAQRTEWNVRDSNGTLILTRGEVAGGTRLTLESAQRLGRPVRVANPGPMREAVAVREWIEREGIRVLNVAGPRESEQPGIGHAAERFLLVVFGHER